MKKELKKQIKQDELVTGAERVWSWLATHREGVRATALVVAAAAVLGGGLSLVQGRRARESQRALSEALDLFHAPLKAQVSPAAGAAAAGAFATAEEKYTKAAAAFDGVERRYASQPAGLTGAYYAALCRVELGKTAEAEKALAALAARRDPGRLEPALARLAMADLYRRTGQVDKAADAYRQAAEDVSLPLPRDHALIGLASLLEEGGRLDEARAAYQRLVAEFPTSVYAPDARSRAAYLETAAKG
jgi:tetratricopeptide (TPR) repeat protein